MRRRVGFLFICSAALPIAVFAASAWACGALVTISSSLKVAPAGGTVTVTGRNFGTTGFSDVQLRWATRTGDVLKSVPVGTDPARPTGFSADVQVPASATPGWYVINATQFNVATGVTKSGSPGRTTVRVQGSAAAGAAPWGAGAPTGSGGPGTGGPDLPVPALLLSAGLLATGLALVGRGRDKRPARSPLGV